MGTITTRNLHMHSAQEVLNYVCRAIIAQGVPAHTKAGCAYRTPTTPSLKCAFGQILTGDDYQALLAVFKIEDLKGNLMEPGRITAFNHNPGTFAALGWMDSAGQPAQCMVVNGRNAPTAVHFDLLEKLQFCHDMAAFTASNDPTKRFLTNFSERVRTYVELSGGALTIPSCLHDFLPEVVS